ncbi:MAG: arginine--tRNA ligase [Alphaproteobacteria bacterium]|nr:arginine--tRNA ligase [Alphaproteobacteria bacterium]
MNIFNQYRDAVVQAVTSVFPNVDLTKLTLEPPRDASHGDLATNAAMILPGQTGKKPREIADAIKPELEKIKGVLKVDIAGPGFINMTLDVSAWRNVLPIILEQGTAFGDSQVGKHFGKVNVEYVSANPTGPLHIGHARGAVYGDALARLLLKAGYDVTKEYYINDAGGQVEVLAKSAFLRYREACGETIGEIPEGLYPGEYLKAAGETIKTQLGADVKEGDPRIKQIAIEEMMKLIKHDLADLGIFHDVFTSEAKLHADKMVDKAIDKLKAGGHIYRGVLEAPKGETPDDWEPEEQLLFRATEFGDDSDRTVEKANGARTYFAGDLGLTLDKINRGFTTLIYMFGADHGGYVKRMEAMTAALSDKTASVDIKLCQLVHLFKNGEPVRMSKRAGNFVTVRDVLDEVGKDILRFVMLMRKTNQDMEFDFDKVKEQSKENPVFYVQYAHARCKSLLRMAAEQAPDALNAAPDFSVLTHPAEMALIKKLAEWPRQVEQAAAAHEPHRIIYYLQELASAFHGLWNVGSTDAEIRFILPDAPQQTTARLALARAMANVVASGLAVCGVQPVEELRG